jgi:hypothetical protein
MISIRSVPKFPADVVAGDGLTVTKAGATFTFALDPAFIPSFDSGMPYAAGDLLVADGASSVASLADIATGNVLLSGGIGAAPSYGKVGISTHVSGLGTGVATFLGTPTSANLAAAVVDSTGYFSGAVLVFNTRPSFVGAVTTVSTDAGATAEPNFSTWRNSATPAANDLIGYFSFFGNKSTGTGNFYEYGRIQGAILDPTVGSEDGQISFQTAVAGTLADRVTIYTGVQIGSPTGGDKGAGTLNAAGSIYSNNVLALLASDIGVTVQAFDSDLSAVAGLSSTGLIARTGTGTAAVRTITGTAAEIDVANGSGVSNNPTLSLPSALTFTGKTVTGGTFSGPTLSGTVAGSPTASGTWTFSVGTATIQLTDAGASAGPNLSLYRNSASPAASDLIGYLSYFGQNTSTFFEYARAGATILDPNASSEDAEWYVSTAVAGTLAARATIGQGLQIGSPTGGDKGSGTINAAGTIYVNNSALARAADKLSFFAATTSAELAGVISDETGSGLLVFGTAPTLSAAILSGTTNVSGGQLAFPASQSASADANTLDDYEEGTWTPVLSFLTPGDLSVSYSVQVGTYTKIGRLVQVSGQVTTSAFTFTTASGNVRLTGLPFTSANVSNQNAFGGCQWSGVTKATYTHACAVVFSNVSIMNFSASGSGVALANITAADMPTGGSVILGGSVAYVV